MSWLLYFIGEAADQLLALFANVKNTRKCIEAHKSAENLQMSTSITRNVPSDPQPSEALGKHSNKSGGVQLGKSSIL